VSDTADREYYLNAKLCQELINKLQTDKVCLTSLIHDNSENNAKNQTETLELLCEYYVTIKNFLDFLNLVMTTQSKINSEELGDEYVITEIHRQTIDLYNGTIILLEVNAKEEYGIILARQ
tara:strand:+ start:337 stop:699 length:363 start_codon:yes stop_codon:yes gene_type:complete